MSNISNSGFHSRAHRIAAVILHIHYDLNLFLFDRERGDVVWSEPNSSVITSTEQPSTLQVRYVLGAEQAAALQYACAQSKVYWALLGVDLAAMRSLYHNAFSTSFYTAADVTRRACACTT